MASGPLITSKRLAPIERQVTPSFGERPRFNTLNIDGAGEGFGSFGDDYYRTWPRRVSEKQVQVNGYLVSLTPAEELAQFLGARGHCSYDNGHSDHAARMYEEATRFDWRRPCYRAWFVDAAMHSGYVPKSAALQAMLDVAQKALPPVPPELKHPHNPR